LQISLRLKVILAFLSIYTIWGSTYLGIKFAIETIPPFLMAGFRFIIAGTLLYTWTWTKGVTRPSSKNWIAASIVGCSLLLLGNGGVVWAEQSVPSGLTAVLITTVPLWMVLLEWFRNEHVRPSKETILGLIIGFTGVIFLIGPETFAGDSSIDRFAAIIVVFAALSWAAGSLYSRKASLPKSALQSTGMEMITGGVMMFFVGAIFQEFANFNIAKITLTSWLAFFYLIVLGSLIGFTSYIWLLTKTTSARVSTYAYVNPIVAVILGWTFANEQLTLRTLVSSLVIIAAVVLITSRRVKSPVKPNVPAIQNSGLDERVTVQAQLEKTSCKPVLKD
jgi:drug/metabolite transporter (DMT)-like permease